MGSRRLRSCTILGRSRAFVQEVTGCQAWAPAHATPTIVHFSAVLLLSAVVRVPWHTIDPAAALWGLTGLSGFVYELFIIWRMRETTTYRPKFEDWFFHIVMPLSAYALLAASAVAAFSRPEEAQFAVGVATLMLLFAGIHNAWDAVTWHVLVRRVKAPASQEEKPT
jgi:hypothetical protein